MKWFKHDTSSSRTEKLAMLKATRGLEGYGFYWNVLEIIAESGERTAEAGVISLNMPVEAWCAAVGTSPQSFKKLAEICSRLGLFRVEVAKASGKWVATVTLRLNGEVSWNEDGGVIFPLAEERRV